MSVPDESAVESASSMPDVATEDGDTGVPRPASRAVPGRIPLTVTALVMQWSKLNFALVELAQLGYDQISVRLAAGWPDLLTFSELNLEDVVDELTAARQVMAERVSRHRGGDRGHDASQQADAAWVQRWADRLARAGWMPIGDQSAVAVAHAIERARIDCDQVRQLALDAGTALVQSGILKITT